MASGGNRIAIGWTLATICWLFAVMMLVMPMDYEGVDSDGDGVEDAVLYPWAVWPGSLTLTPGVEVTKWLLSLADCAFSSKTKQKQGFSGLWQIFEAKVRVSVSHRDKRWRHYSQEDPLRSFFPFLFSKSRN